MLDQTYSLAIAHHIKSLSLNTSVADPDYCDSDLEPTFPFDAAPDPTVYI